MNEFVAARALLIREGEGQDFHVVSGEVTDFGGEGLGVTFGGDGCLSLFTFGGDGCLQEGRGEGAVEARDSPKEDMEDPAPCRDACTERVVDEEGAATAP